MRIRQATAADLPRLRDIERAAGEPFRTVGMAAIAEDEPPALDVLEEFRRAGRAWVAVIAPEDEPVAYLIAEPVDGALHGEQVGGALHVEQVSVHPSVARRGVGRALLDHAAAYARRAGLGALTLTTFAEVPWNAPYYRRLGFRVLGERELGPGLRKIRAYEDELGLDRWPRVCMVRPTAL
ncbi:GNAT family N-acetyltransferase [Streptomyces sp. YC504]|uniref:GNAT family N-acetyltransferase n=1 Tax=Streptomyces mesophilus TaxID=1775132 RepID=A0A6G4XMS6_9ACTN|nr:GNAT family N-acetyltransferase [Streptomyces mesophilus]NGO78533.1 GNAT family N-acetyltransferase [Streptomyces mesophilus]